MTIGIVATVRILEGKAAEFEAAFTALAKEVRAKEPGNIAYQLTKSRTEPNVYKALEIYKDQDAINQHGRSDHYKAAGAKLGAVFAAPPELEFLDGVE